MKNSKEMADAVFRIRDACLERQAKRNRLVRRIAAAGSAVCMLGLVVIGIRYGHPAQKPLPNTIRTTETAALTEHLSEPQPEETAPSTEAPILTHTTPLPLETAGETAADTAEETSAESEQPTEAVDASQQDPTEPPADSQTDSGRQPEPTEQAALPTDPMESPQIPTPAPTAAPASSTQDATTDNTQVEPQETAYDAPPQEDSPPAFLFRRAELGDPPMTYGTTEKPVEPELIREELGEVKLFSETQEITGKAFRIEGFAPEEAIAVQFIENEGYYFYVIARQ